MRRHVMLMVTSLVSAVGAGHHAPRRSHVCRDAPPPHGLRPEFLQSSGALLFTWTPYLLGVLGFFSIVLAALELRRPSAEPR